MSATIGPIHHWLYKKIKFQEDAVKALFNVENISEDVNNLFEELPEGNLEDVIDSTNIHGWLQECINIVEKRLAYTTTTLLSKGYTIDSLVKAIVPNLENSNKSITTAVDAYGLLDTYLLNGMPCDGVNKVILDTEFELVYIETKQIHSDFWELFNGDIINYYLIRKAMANSILKETKFVLEINDQHEFVIKLKEKS